MKRIYGVTKPIVGLTGGIATGKSTVTNILKDMGLFVICADTLVHDIYKKKESIEFIKKISPESIVNGEIDFKKLRKTVFSDKDIKKDIEAFIYGKLEAEFIENLKARPDAQFIIYDVPLLFELDLHLNVDTSICVYCPREIQLERILSRDNHSRELAESIINNQMDIEKKKGLADHVITNIHDLEHLKKEVDHVFKNLNLKL